MFNFISFWRDFAHIIMSLQLTSLRHHTVVAYMMVSSSEKCLLHNGTNVDIIIERLMILVLKKCWYQYEINAPRLHHHRIIDSFTMMRMLTLTTFIKAIITEERELYSRTRCSRRFCQILPKRKICHDFIYGGTFKVENVMLLTLMQMPTPLQNDCWHIVLERWLLIVEKMMSSSAYFWFQASR